MEALKKYRDYADSSAWNKYNCYLAAIVDGFDPSDTISDGDTFYEMHEFRRGCVIARYSSQGFVSAEFYDHESALPAFDRIRDDIDEERASIAWEEHPDRWGVCWVAHCGMSACAYTCDDGRDARDEIARRLRRFRRLGQTITRIGDDRWEVSDPDDAVMVSDDAGFLYIHHIDNEDERERMMDMMY